MTLTVSRLAAMVLALAIASPPVLAQTYAQSQAQRIYSQAELDQMLAPVALYPDPLLSQVLMAATYPAEVAEAARWSRANPGLQGDDAVRAAHDEDWDPSVQSLVAFPQILARMDENPAWTRSLGDAFVAQEPHVMDTVQQLRQRARATGQLVSDERLHVVEQSNSIAIQPANLQYVHVPYYDPLVVYGPWWWPAYQPVVWAPWPGYARHYRPGVSAGFWWGTPVGLSLNFFFGNFDWRYRQVRVVHPGAHYYRSAAVANRTLVATPHRWQHEPRRREAFAERRPVQVRQQIQMQSQVQRQERQQSRSQANALTSIQAQPAPQAQPSAQVQSWVQRQERRGAVSPERQERRIEQPQGRQQSRSQANALTSIQAQPQVQPQPRAQPQARQEQRPSMPAAQAPQQPRAERQEQRQERRELRQEMRDERGLKGSWRS